MLRRTDPRTVLCVDLCHSFSSSRKIQIVFEPFRSISSHGDHGGFDRAETLTPRYDDKAFRRDRTSIKHRAGRGTSLSSRPSSAFMVNRQAIRSHPRSLLERRILAPIAREKRNSTSDCQGFSGPNPPGGQYGPPAEGYRRRSTGVC